MDRRHQPQSGLRIEVDPAPIRPEVLDRATVLDQISLLKPAPQHERLILSEKATPLEEAHRRWIGRAIRGQKEGFRDRTPPRLRDALLKEAKVAPDFRFKLDPSLIVPVEPAPTGPELSTTTSPDGQIILLALICKQLGLSPNPDPDYSWP